MGSGFAGVELPADIGESSQSTQEQISTSEPSGAPEAKALGEQEAVKSQESASPEIPDLDKLERFRFGGREMTRKEFENERMMRQDYTRKTQELSESRKYATNFHIDLGHVVANPQLLDKFKEIYPQEFVDIAEKILSQRAPQAGSQPAQATEASKQPLPMEVQEALRDVKAWKAEVQEQKVQATLEQINSMHERMEQKYPFADPDVVDTRVQIAIEKGLEVTKDNLSKVIENAYKQHHDAIKSRLDSQQKSKVEEQVNAGKAARDVGTGGSPSGGAPKKYKKMSDLSKDVEAAFSSK